MAEALGYVVVCACDGRIEALAYIDDNRPAGGSITVSAPTPENKHIVSATGYNPEVEDWRAPDKFVTDKWAEHPVTETMWNDSRFGWTIRCERCGRQAQINEVKLTVIADEAAAHLAVDPDAPPVPTPGVDDPSAIEHRHVIQFGAMLSRLSRFTR